MDYKKEIENRLQAASVERSRKNSYTILEEVLKLCTEWYKKDMNSDSLVARALTLQEIAIEEQNLKDRSKKWKEALETLDKPLRNSPSHTLIEAYANIATNLFNDKLSGVDLVQKQVYLQTAQKYLNTFIDISKN